MAYHDGLTDLPNRAAVPAGTGADDRGLRSTDEEFAVLSVDLDGLKEINDVFGHAIGDKLLIEVSRRIQTSARGGVVARLSGDEFGLIIDGKQPSAGKALAEQLAEVLAQEFPIDGKSVRIGVTQASRYSRTTAPTAASLLANAGAALFRAKAKSRGSIRSMNRDGPADSRSPRAAPGSLARDQERRAVAALSSRRRPRARRLPAAKSLASRRWRGAHPIAAFVPPGDFIRSRKKRLDRRNG